MARMRPARRILGFRVEINRTGEKKNWEPVGYLFRFRGEASQWALRNYPDAVAHRVTTIRVDAAPLAIREADSDQRRRSA